MTVPPALAAYVDELVARVGDVNDVEAAYLVGSGSYGGFVSGVSDVDVVIVVPQPLAQAQKEAVVAAAESVAGNPGRKLELVVYAAGQEDYELNLNTGELVSFDPSNDPRFWFVLDRAIAEQHAVPLVGAPWRDVFPPVEREDVLDALDASLAWHEREEPGQANTVLNATRTLRWLEDGVWGSKPDGAAWLLQRVRTAIEEAK